MPTRNDAYELMTSHVKNENLRKHMLAVDAPVTKCHSRTLAAVLPELIALFSLPA